MPRKTKNLYSSYNLSSGIIQGEEDQIFTNFNLSKIQNLRYAKEDALYSIPQYLSLGTLPNGDPVPDFIQMTKFKETPIGLTYKEIYRMIDFNEEQKHYDFEKIGSYLNADTNTQVVTQLNENLFDPALAVNGDYAYVAFRKKGSIIFNKVSLKQGFVDQVAEIQNTDDKYQFLKIDVDATISEEDGVKLSFVDTSDMSAKFLYPYGDLTVQDSTEDLNTIPTLEDPVINSKTLYNFRVWGSFVWDNNTYSILWNENDAYFIVKDDGSVVGKIGAFSSPSFDEDFFMTNGNIVIDNDCIHFPVLISNKEALVTTSTEIEEGQDTLQSQLFYPVGVSIISLKINREVPQTNQVEFGSGLLFSGPIIQLYDGSQMTEFNFCERLEDFTINNQLSGDPTKDAVSPPVKKDVELNYRAEDTAEVSKTNVDVSTQRTDAVFTYEQGNLSTPVFTNEYFGSRIRASDGRIPSENILGPSGGTDRYDYNNLRSSSPNIFFEVYGGGTADDNDASLNEFFIKGTGELTLRIDFNPRDAADRNDIFNSNTIYLAIGKSRAAVRRGDCYIYNLSDISFPSSDGRFDISDQDPVHTPINGDTIDESFDYIACFTDYSYEASEATGIASSFEKLLDVGGQDTDYSAKITQNSTSTVVEVRNDANSQVAPEPNFFTKLVIAENGGTDEQEFTLSGGNTDDNVRTFSLVKGSLELDASKNYDLTFTTTTPPVWRSDSPSLSFVSNSKTTNITNLEISEDARTLCLFTDGNASDVINRNILLISIGLNKYLFQRGNNDQDKIVYEGIDDQAISDLVGIANENRTLNLEFSNTSNSDLDLLTMDTTTYQHAGIFKWIDHRGKEHYSALSFSKAHPIFGRLGSDRSGNRKIQSSFRFKNMNLTSKNDVYFVLLRARLTGRSPSSFYRIVKEIPVNLDDEFIDVTDDVLENDTYGTIDPEIYDQIFQPAGANRVAIGRRNRVFLSNIIGFENALFFSNQISNQKVDIFSFLRNSTQSGRIFFDRKVLGLGNLDTNLAVFTDEAIFNLPVETLRPNLVQESVFNSPSQKEAISIWKKGVTYVNQKGIQYLGRGFNCHWLSKDIIDEVEGNPLDSSPPNCKIIEAYSSEIDRELRFRCLDGRVLVYDTEYEKWTTEDYIVGPEIEAQDKRFKVNDGKLYISPFDPNVEETGSKREFSIETGWINFSEPNSGVILTTIDLVGTFGNADLIRCQMLYNLDERLRPENDHNVDISRYLKTLDDGTQILRVPNLFNFASKMIKIQNIKLKFTIISDNVKLTSVGFFAKKQVNESPKPPTSQKL